jgi:hypothetical protein
VDFAATVREQLTVAGFLRSNGLFESWMASWPFSYTPRGRRHRSASERSQNPRHRNGAVSRIFGTLARGRPLATPAHVHSAENKQLAVLRDGTRLLIRAGVERGRDPSRRRAERA